ncbi:MAG: type II toxin-antitoxin system HicA family toxin [Lachnospiraceae bacterium]
MKHRDLIKRIENGGFQFERHGCEHDIYRREHDRIAVPRHKEINEKLANAILRKWGL